MWQQRTIAHPVSCTGVTLQTGQPVTLNLKPAGPGRGIFFTRVDLEDRPKIEARVENVVDSTLATTLGKGDVQVGVVEHLLAALAGLGVDNLEAEVDGPELPFMDGSAAPFVMLIRSAGVHCQDAPRQVVKVKKPIQANQGDKQVTIQPSDKASISFTIEFDHPLLENQELTVPVEVEHFAKDICRARTFGFAKDVVALKKMGCFKGGSLDNAVIIDDFKVVNPSGLRFDDEFVRHKILDMVGDLSLLGRPIIGRVEAYKSGHALNHQLVKALKDNPSAWELVTLSPETSPEMDGAAAPQLWPVQGAAAA